MNIKITGSGSYIPKIVQDNSKFLDREFFDNEGNKIVLIIIFHLVCNRDSKWNFPNILS